MDEIKFFRRAVAPTLAEIVEWTGAKPVGEVDLGQTIVDVAPLDRARPGDLVFLDNPKYVDQLARTRATACLVGERYADACPRASPLWSCANPIAPAPRSRRGSTRTPRVPVRCSTATAFRRAPMSIRRRGWKRMSSSIPAR